MESNFLAAVERGGIVSHLTLARRIGGYDRMIDAAVVSDARPPQEAYEYLREAEHAGPPAAARGEQGA